jgi:hypothetical protein
MQLNKNKMAPKRKKGKLCATLGLMTATLFAASDLDAQEKPDAASSYFGDKPVNTTGGVHLDQSVLYYQESGGRIRVIEPAAELKFNNDRGDIFTFGLISDSITGASPVGAVALKRPQILAQDSSTGASGVSAAGEYPLIFFNDQREVLDIACSRLISKNTHLNLAGSISKERDYLSLTGSLGLAKDLNEKNTSLSIGVNYEADFSAPHFGAPTPLTVILAIPSHGNRRKGVVGVILGVTQVMNRHWVAQLNYSYGYSKGYQTDPYRIISVIDPSTAVNPAVSYLYESRPEKRIRQSVYIGNKIAIGHTVTDISGRFYHDSWGITSKTVEASERVPLNSWIYIEPHARFYSQTKANFFYDYLIMGQALPDYASSDSRLGKFTATTLGVKIGFKMWETGELYMRAESYQQHGDSQPANVIPAVAGENLFTGVKVVSAIIGLGFDF